MKPQPSRRGRPTGHSLIDTETIKRVARAQMAQLGTAGLSLRGIARALDVTAPCSVQLLSPPGRSDYSPHR